MNHDELFRFLLWCLALNYGVLIIWFAMLVFARDWVRTLHGKWFSLSDSVFDAIHYGGMGLYKIGILLFNLTPLVALYVMRSGA